LLASGKDGLQSLLQCPREYARVPGSQLLAKIDHRDRRQIGIERILIALRKRSEGASLSFCRHLAKCDGLLLHHTAVAHDPPGQCQPDQLSPFGLIGRFQRGRGTPQNHCGARELPELQGDLPGMIHGRAILLVAGIVLLIEDDQPQIRHGAQDRRACAHHQPQLTGTNPPPLIIPLTTGEAAMHDGDRVRMSGSKAADDLRRQRDLWHQDDGAKALSQHLLRCTQVELGLATAGDALQQERRAPMRAEISR